MELSASYNTLQEPKVLKYLSGEISFEAWLDAQQDNQQHLMGCDDYPTANNYTHRGSSRYDDITDHHESSSVFSSWGSAFTGVASEGVLASGGGDDETVTEDSEGDETEEEEQNESDFDGAEGSSCTGSESTQHWKLVLPSYTNITPNTSMKESNVQGVELVPIIELLYPLISTCKIRKKMMNVRKRRLSRQDRDEPLDIVTDFQQFQFRKRNRKCGTRTRLPELLRLQMGQANRLVAKGDFKRAADICMEIVREAPSSGLPFTTLSFIYEEQGNKEMSLQYSLISAFLGCKDAQEWRELAKKCSDAGNRKQAIACYDRGCRYAGGDISVHWERANMYFDEQEYKKVLDIYLDIYKLLVPPESPDSPYITVAKRMSKLFYKYGLVDRAAEVLDIAFSTCPTAEDSEGINMLSEMLIGAKKYKRAIKLIASHCNVGLPVGLFQSPKFPHSEHDLESINKFVSETLTGSKDVSSLATQLVDSNLTRYSGDRDIDKQYTTLHPLQHRNVSHDEDENEDELEEHLFQIPDSLQLSLRVKLAFSLIQCSECAAVQKILKPLLSKDISEVGDMMLTIGEAYFDVGKHEEALKYLKPLTDIKKYNQPTILLKLADIYDRLDEEQHCIDTYYKVLKLAPLQASVRLNLATFLRSAGRDDEAMAVLLEYEDKHKDDEGDDVTILSDEYILKVEEYEEWYRKCVDMYSKNNLHDFICHSYILMHNYLMSSYSYSKKQMVGKALVWELLLKTLKVCMKFKEYRKAIRLVEQALLFKAYSESRKYRLELDYLQTTIYFVAGKYSKAFDSFRNLLIHETEREINGNAIWNLFTQIVNKMLDKRHHRFTLRLLFKRPRLIPLIIQNGNNSHLSGTYKYAIGEFSRAFREWPQYPLNSLLLGVSYLHLSCQKFHKTRHTSILHGLIFILQYFNLRGENQEAYYNVGRAFHQIGLVHLAVHYYNKSLQFPLHNEKNEINDEETNDVSYHPHIDLHREVAFNLSLIYKASGNNELARQIIYRYCWI